MKKSSKKIDQDDELSDLEQNLEENLYSKSNLEEDYLAPSLSPEEFQKLWDEKKIDVERESNPSQENISNNGTRLISKITSPCTQSDNLITHEVEQYSILQALNDSITEVKAHHNETVNTNAKRGLRQNLKTPIVRVLRIPLNHSMEDQLITIRRLLNELRQVNNPREVIDDHQVLQALLNWASKQLDQHSSRKHPLNTNE